MGPTRNRDRGIHPTYLRAWRRYRLMSGPELAERAGITRSAVSRLETKEGATANVSTVAKLAKALGITREQLVREAPPDVDHQDGAA